MWVLFLGLLGFLVYDAIIAVPDGSVAVATSQIKNLGPIPTAPRVLGPGLHIGVPLVTRLHSYSTRVQMLTVEVPMGGGVKFKMTAQVRLNSDSAPAVDERMGPLYLKEILTPTLAALIEREIYTSRGDVSAAEAQQEIETAVRDSLSREGLTLGQTFLTRVEHLELNAATPSGDDEESDTDEN